MGSPYRSFIKKIASGFYAINAVKRLLPIHNLRQLDFSLIHSHLSYGLLLWGSAFEYRRKKVTKKRVIRNIIVAFEVFYMCLGYTPDGIALSVDIVLLV